MRKSAYGNILEVSSYAGKILLENGAEIYRVEQTVTHICRAYGIDQCDCFATPTAIIISVIGKGGEVHSVVRRITSRRVNLRKVELINEFSRNIGQASSSFDEIKRQLKQIENLSSYPLLWTAVTAGIGTAAFTVIFGGGLWNFICGLFAGALIHLLITKISDLGTGTFFTNLIGGAVSA